MRVARSALAARDVVFEIRESSRHAVDRVERDGGERRPAQVRVQHDARGVDHAPQRTTRRIVHRVRHGRRPSLLVGRRLGVRRPDRRDGPPNRVDNHSAGNVLEQRLNSLALEERGDTRETSSCVRHRGGGAQCGGLDGGGRPAGGRVESGRARVVSFGGGLGRGTWKPRVCSAACPTRFRNPRVVIRYDLPGTSGVLGESVTTTTLSGASAFGLAGGGGGRAPGTPTPAARSRRRSGRRRRGLATAASARVSRAGQGIHPSQRVRLVRGVDDALRGVEPGRPLHAVDLESRRIGAPYFDERRLQRQRRVEVLVERDVDRHAVVDVHIGEQRGRRIALDRVELDGRAHVGHVCDGRIPLLVAIDLMVRILIDQPAHEIRPAVERTDVEMSCGVAHGDELERRVGPQHRLDVRVGHGVLRRPIEHDARDSEVRNRRTGGEDDRRAFLAHVAAQVGEAGEHRHDVRGVRAKLPVQLDRDALAMPRHVGIAVARRDEKQLRQVRRAQRCLRDNLVELKVDLPRPHVELARVGLDRENHGRVVILGAARRLAGRRARHHEPPGGDGDQPPHNDWTRSVSWSRFDFISSRIARSPATTSAGARSRYFAFDSRASRDPICVVSCATSERRRAHSFVTSISPASGTITSAPPDEHGVRRCAHRHAVGDPHVGARQPADGRRFFAEDVLEVRVARAQNDLDRLSRCDVVLGADLTNRQHRLAHELELLRDVGVAGENLFLLPGPSRQVVGPLGGREERPGVAAGQLLPERLGHEWHDRMQETERVVERVDQHGTRHFAVVAAGSRAGS